MTFPETAEVGPLHRHDSSPVDALSTPESSATLESLRTRGWWRLRFPPALEAVYARERLQARLRTIDICNMAGTALFFGTTAGDAANAPLHAPLIAIRRWEVTALLLAVALFGVWRGQRRRTWEPDLVVSFSFIAAVTYGLTLARLAESPLSEITASALFLVIMHSAIILRQQFQLALGVASGVCIGYAVTSADATGSLQALVDGNLRLLVTTAVLSLIANYVLERRQRQAFVLHRCEAEHQRALASGVQVLHRLSHCDPLTGISNRRYFDKLLDEAWLNAGRAGRVGLLFLDIDHFKLYNDHYGHPAGDTCLQAVATAIEATARAHGGSVARVGGEEFAVLLPGLATGASAQADAGAIAEAVCSAVRRLGIVHAWSASGSVVTVSVGMSVACPYDGRGIAQFQASADEALYAAKNAGRDRWAAAPIMDTPAPTAPPVKPAATESPTTRDPSSAWQQRLHEALKRPVWRLTFPPELEADYDHRFNRRRGLRLFFLGMGGMLVSLSYTLLSGAMYPQVADIVDEAMRREVVFIHLPLLLLVLLPMKTWLRESIFALAAVLPAVTSSLLASVNPTTLLQSHAIAVFLVPLFSAVIAEQPFRYCLSTSIAALLISGWTLWPGSGASEVTTAWMLCLGMKTGGTVYSLIASYLLERSTRYNHVLTRLDEAHSVAMQRQTDHLRHLTTIDPVTGIANRRRYDEEQARLWAECAAMGQPLSLLLLDVDHFKRYNDVYGHPAGDACLRTVAQALAQWSNRRAVRGGLAGLTARLGGEEFAVLLPGCDAADALTQAASLCAEVAGLRIEHTGSTTSEHLTVSIGAASITPTGGNDLKSASTDLLSAADAALYRAKQAGRNCARA